MTAATTAAQATGPAHGASTRTGVLQAAWSLAAFAGLFALRLPFLSSHPVNWDAVQFALATQRFDLDLYQPHPPGYLVYVALGSALTRVVGDPNVAFGLLAAASAAAATVLFWHLARALDLPARWCWLASVAFGCSPLLWYASTVALTYALECAAAVLFALLAWRAAQTRSAAWLLAAALTLGLAAGVRQTTLVLLLPLALWAAWKVRRPAALVAAGLTLALAIAAWLLPLVALAGGLEPYLAITTRLAGDVLQPASRDLGAWGLVLNSGYTVLALAMALGGALFAVPWALAGLRRPRLAGPPRALFLLLWSLPAILIFATVHIGQPGYALLVLAPLLLAISSGLARRFPAWPQGNQLRSALVVTAAVCIVTGFGGHRLLQSSLTALESASDPAWVEALTLAQSHAPLFGLRRSELDWDQVRAAGAGYAPGELVVFTSAGILGAFRHAGYYFPDQPVWGIWMTPERGWFFPALRAGDGQDYAGLNQPQATIALPPNARAALVIDDPFAGCLTLDAPIERIPIGFAAVYRIPIDGQRQVSLTTSCLP